jgi:alpha-glucuronidase
MPFASAQDGRYQRHSTGDDDDSVPGQLWLYRAPVSLSYAAKAKPLMKYLHCSNTTASEPLGRACQEISDGIAALLGVRPMLVPTIATSGTVVVEVVVGGDGGSPWPPNPAAEGFAVSTSERSGHACIAVTGKSGVGTLYGVFRLLNLIRRELLQVVAGIPGGVARGGPGASGAGVIVLDAPVTPIRTWDLWDNRDRSVERGYAGKSIFEYENLPTMMPRWAHLNQILGFPVWTFSSVTTLFCFVAARAFEIEVLRVQGHVP